MDEPVVSDQAHLSTCPLCGSQAKQFPTSGDWKRYACPNDKTFDITGSAQAEAKGSESVRQRHRERIAHECKMGIAIPKIGVFSKK